MRVAWDWVRQRLRSPRVILGLGFAAFLLYAYPGYMSIDSGQQLGEARSHQYSDWHPPAMAALWTVVELFISGPLGMLLLQSAAFLAGAYRLLCRQFTRRTAAIIAVSVLLFPPILAPMAVIWKDSQMAGYLLFGLSLVLDDRPRLRWIGLGLITAACAMRHNAAAATVPLFAFALIWRAGQPIWKRLAIAAAIWALTTGTAILINAELTVVPQHPWHTALATSDIAGVLRFSPQYTDSELLDILRGTPLITHENIAANAHKYYRPSGWWEVMSGDTRLFDWPKTKEERDAIAGAWRTLVTDNPRAYLHHRLSVFREVLALTRPPVDTVFHGFVDDNYSGPLHYNFSPARLQLRIAAVLEWLADKTFLFLPYVYLAIALMLVPFVLRQRDLLALLTSGIAYELALVPLAPTPDFRYSHWMIVATTLTTIMLVARRAAASGAPSISATPMSRSG